MPKWVKFIIAVLLLPLCIGAGSAVTRVLSAAGDAQAFWVALVGGAGCWFAIFLLLPKPMWIYVFGHELTHAVWTWLCAGKVKRFKVTPKGGHVIITKSNFLIALAPYFFPLYVAIIIVVFIVGHLIWNWSRYLVWFHFFVGAAYAFHVTLTWHILQTRQTDITEQGYLFSGVIIWLGNLGVLIIGIPLLTAKVRLLDALVWWLEGTTRAVPLVHELVILRQGAKRSGFVNLTRSHNLPFRGARTAPRKGVTPMLTEACQRVRVSIMKTRVLLIPLAAALVVSNSFAQAVKDREAAVRGDRATVEKDARWIYNDFQKGLTQAKWSGKPLLVVLRCVPCRLVAGIDASVLNEPDLQPLLDQFVCVRIINANALDLALFQFDYDLSFSTLFFNGDGTIYGRYGSWAHQKNPQDKTTAGYKRALESALAIHRNYPSNKSALAGKQGGIMPFKTPVQFPTLSKYKATLDWEGKVVQSCIHCHQIGDAYRASYRSQSKPVPFDLIYPMPQPETIGLTLAPDHAARVGSIAAGSIAAKAGVQAGDEIVSLAGQPLVSIADVSWVLHRAPESGSLAAIVKRDEAEKTLSITLPPQWRAQADISRRVGTWQMRGMATGGLVLEDLTDTERSQRGVEKDKMALFIKHVGEYGQHAAAEKAGFQKGDVLVELDGGSRRVSEGELIGQLLQKHQPGEKLKAVVFRGKERIELSLPMQ